MKTQPSQEIYNDIKVMYVEDDSCIREAVLDYLSGYFKNIIVAKDGSEGIQFYRDEKPDIVLTDIRMPVMDGMELSRQIKEINPDVKIIITSSYTDTNFLIEAIDIGINEYVLKPVNNEKLLQALTKVANHILMERKLKIQWQTISRFHSAIDQSQSIVVITDKDLRINYMNSRFTDITGFQYEEIIGNGSDKSFDTIFNTRQNQGFKDVLENGNPILWRGEYSIESKDEQKIWLYGSLSPVLDENGAVNSYVLVGENISEIKKMAARLADQEDKLRNLIENLGEGIAVIDMTYDFLFCNESMKEIFETDELTHKNFSEFITGTGEMENLIESFRKIQPGEKISMDISIRTSSSQKKQLQMTASLQQNSSEDGMNGWFCIFRDISQVKELIEELEAARDDAQKAYQTIEEKNMELGRINEKLKESEFKLSELNNILLEYIKATGK